jgi:hypothetical protein
MSLDLRPLTLPELLDRSFIVYKRHIWLFVGIMAVPSALALGAGVLFRVFNTTPPPGLTPEAALALLAPLLVGSFLFVLAYLAVYLLALGATTVAVSDIYLGRETSISTAYARVRGKGGRLVLLMIFFGLRTFGIWVLLMAAVGALTALLAVLLKTFALLVLPFGFLAAVVLATLFTVRYGVSVPVVALEDVTAGRALGRSVELTQGHLWRVFLLWLCATVIAYATGLVFQGPFLFAAFLAGPASAIGLVVGIIGAMAGAIGGMFTGPFMMIGLALLYYDLRIRKEALDIHLLLDSLEPVSPGV